MPQIKITEVDNSVVTRVIQNDMVTILAPVIASFGPSYDGNGTDVTANTFTDVTAYDRVYGYTPAQYNPIKSDVSRTYVRELIKRGAAVTVVRINGGSVAEYDLGGTSAQRQTPSYERVPMSVKRSAAFAADCADPSENPTTHAVAGTAVTFTLDTTEHQATSAGVAAIQAMLPGSFKLTGKLGDAEDAADVELVDNGSGKLISTKGDGLGGTVNYATAAIVVKSNTSTPLALNVENAKVFVKCVKSGTDYTKYMFAPQISQIQAKYSGSFGNNLLVTISAVNTSRLSESFQYANISVYYVERTVVYDSEGDIDYSRSVVKNTTLLETRMVTTNPNDPRYFEDVEFDFIKIIAADGARDQLDLIWSNILANPTSASMYPGFPVIPFKVSIDGSEYAYGYNNDAFPTKEFGTDFMYSPAVLEKLKQGFKGYIMGTTWTQSDLNAYIQDVYGTENPNTNPCIFMRLMNNIASMYGNFTDKYFYDFDFVTPAGFTYEEYQVVNTAAQDADPVLVAQRTVPLGDTAGSTVYSGITPIDAAMEALVVERKDAMFVVDTPVDYDPMSITEYERLINTSYGCVHAPWCYIDSPYIANYQILMPPSFIFLYTYLDNLDNNVDSQKWYPPAGVKRATARIVKKPKYEIGTVILNAWQNETTSRVNPIMKLKQYGYVIYGQSTALESIDMCTHSALESINVRFVANMVKKKIFDVCLNLAFEPNTSQLWLKFYDAMDSYLRNMMYNEGVYDYRVKMDEDTVTTDDINHLRCPGIVSIAPTRTAEFFDIRFDINEAGVTFID